MGLRIEEICAANQQELNRVDGTFAVDSLLDVVATGFGDTLHFTSVAPYEKRYGEDSFDVSTYIASPDKTAYFAYVDDLLAGQLVLRRNWNHCAYIEDIAVDRSFRRRGVGRALMDRGREWTARYQL